MTPTCGKLNGKLQRVGRKKISGGARKFMFLRGVSFHQHNVRYTRDAYDGMRRSKACRSACDGLKRKNGPIAGVSLVLKMSLLKRDDQGLCCSLDGNEIMQD